MLSNVQVLSSNRRIDQEQARAGTAPTSSVVTLLVSPEDGEKLALATTQGQIVLALRNPLDIGRDGNQGRSDVFVAVWTGAASGGAARVTSRGRAARLRHRRLRTPKVVTGIRGPKVTQEVIKCCN